MENFDDDYLPPIIQQYTPSDDASPTPTLAIIFILITIIACCSFSVSGAIANFVDTGAIIFPEADTDEQKWKRVFTQAQISSMRIGRPFLLASVIIFFGSKTDPATLGNKLHGFSVALGLITLASDPITRIEFITEKGLTWYNNVYVGMQVIYLLLVYAIVYIYYYTGEPPIRLNGTKFHFVFFFLAPIFFSRWLMVSVLPTL